MHNVLGGTIDPHAAYLLLRGMKTLDVRVQRQNSVRSPLPPGSWGSWQEAPWQHALLYGKAWYATGNHMSATGAQR